MCHTCKVSLRRPETQPSLPGEGAPTGRSCLSAPQRHCPDGLNPQILDQNTKGFNVSVAQRPHKARMSCCLPEHTVWVWRCVTHSIVSRRPQSPADPGPAERGRAHGSLPASPLVMSPGPQFPHL